MNWRVAWIVFTTDLLSTLRDRRTWLTMVLVPLLLVPAMLVLAPSTVEQQVRSIDEELPRICIIGAHHGPSLVQFLQASKKVRIIEAADPVKALVNGDVDLIVNIPSGFEGILTRGGQVSVSVHYDASRQRSSLSQSRVENVLKEYSKEIAAARLAKLGIDEAMLTPLHTDVLNIASEEQVGGSFLAMIMPMFLGVWGALGGMYAAIDAVAGEKERGTLEALLATPTPRFSIVTGKYLTVVFTSLVSVLASLLGMYLAFLIKPEAVTGTGLADTLRFALPFGHTLLMLLVILPLSGIFSAIELMLSAFARSFKEAQTYLSPLSILIVLPILATQFIEPGTVGLWVFCVPLINVVFVLKEILLGNINWLHIVVTLGSSLTYVVIVLKATTRLFQKESVLFRT